MKKLFKKAVSIILSVSLVFCLGVSVICSAENTSVLYLCPRNDAAYTTVTSDGRVILGFVTSTKSGVHQSYDIKDVSLTNYLETLKDNISINDVNLCDAMSESTAIELSPTDGLLQIKIRYQQNGVAVKNPFGITSDTEGVHVTVNGGAAIGNYTLQSANAYYQIGETWSNSNGVKYAVPNSSDTQYYEDNEGKFNLVFYIRDENGSGFGDIALSETDAANIAKFIEINKTNYYTASESNSTLTYSINTNVPNYYRLQFRIGENSAGNPFGIDSASEGTFRVRLTEGVMSQTGYYVAPFDYSYDFATKTFSEYVESDSEYETKYLQPNSGLTGTSTTDANDFIVWFNIRDAIDSPTVQGYVSSDEENTSIVKENIYINGIKLADAITEDEKISLNIPNTSQTGNGQFYVTIKRYNEDGTDYENAFGISSETKGLRVALKEEISVVVGENTYNISPIDYYYSFSSGTYTALSGERYLVPHASSQVYNKERAIVKFYVRESITGGASTSVTTDETARNTIISALKVNGISASEACTSVTSGGDNSSYVQINLYLKDTSVLNNCEGFRLTLDEELIISGYYFPTFDYYCKLTANANEAQFVNFMTQCDVNGDTFFDIRDLVSIKIKLLAVNPDCDINLDGSSNSTDLSFIRKELLNSF